MSELEEVYMHAIVDALVFGHGFIRISKTNTEVEVHLIQHSEFDDVMELFNWIKKEKEKINEPKP